MFEQLQKLFNNPKKAVIAIVIVILLFISYAALAEDDHLEVAIGPTYTGEFNGGVALSLSKRFHRNFDVGITMVSAQEWEQVDIGNNGAAWMRFVAHRPENWTPLLPAEVYIGANYWFKEQSPINGCKEGFLLGLAWDVSLGSFWPNVIGVDHRSNGGVCNGANRGQDMLMLGWRF